MDHLRRFNEEAGEDIVDLAISHCEVLIDEGFKVTGGHRFLGDYGAGSNAWTKLFFSMDYIDGSGEASFKNLQDSIEWQKELITCIELMKSDQKLDVKQMGRITVSTTTSEIKFQVEFIHHNRHY